MFSLGFRVYDLGFGAKFMFQSSAKIGLELGIWGLVLLDSKNGTSSTKETPQAQS